MNRKLLSLLVALLCLACSEVSAETLTKNTSGFNSNANTYELGGNGVTFYIEGIGFDRTRTLLGQPYYLTLKKESDYYIKCKDINSGYDVVITKIETVAFEMGAFTEHTLDWGTSNPKWNYSEKTVTDNSTYYGKSLNFHIHTGGEQFQLRSIKIEYTLTPNTYTIAFDSNGGTGTTESVNATYDQDATLTTNGFSKAGYEFTGWNTNADGSGYSYGNGAIVKNLTAENNGTVTLYAIYTPKKYKLTIKDGFGTFGNNECDIDLTNDNFTAYRAGEVSDTSLKFYPITYLPKEQGAFLMGNDGTYEVSVAASAGETKPNYMKAGNGSTPSNGYVLASKGTEYPLGFYKTSVAVPDGKAYLEYAGTTQVKGFAVMASEFGEDEVTAISIVNAESEENDAYSVTGVKVGGNYRGIVIKNGKKLLQK